MTGGAGRVPGMSVHRVPESKQPLGMRGMGGVEDEYQNAWLKIYEKHVWPITSRLYAAKVLRFLEAVPQIPPKSSDQF